MDIQYGNTLWVNTDHGRDLIREFLAFSLSLQLMFDQTLSNLIVCLMISQKKLHRKGAQTS